MYKNVALPTDEKGRAYISDQMMEDHQELIDLVERTKNSWYHDDEAMVWRLYPSIPSGDIFVRIKDPTW